MLGSTFYFPTFETNFIFLTGWSTPQFQCDNVKENTKCVGLKLYTITAV